MARPSGMIFTQDVDFEFPMPRHRNVAGPPGNHGPMPPLSGSTGRGILIGMLSAFGSAILVAVLLALVYFFRYTTRGRIFLDRIGRAGEFDDEQAFAKEEAEALEEMNDIERLEYMRAKAFVQANPPESVQTDISLGQFLAIQEKGVSAWEFEPALEIANCFVEGRTEIEFFDTECSVQSNLPVPKQNEVYYWEAKIYDKPDTTTIGIGMSTKPYPLFRMPGFHKTSVAYLSPGHRRFNQPFHPTANYGPPFVRGDVVGVGFRPRTGTVFFTRNGKKLEDVTHTLKTQNLFPTVGATGPCTVHVNFGQMGFVFIEANVKKWGLAPMTGSLAPPPPYGSEAGSILLEGGQHGVAEGQGGGYFLGPHSNQPYGHSRSRSAQLRLSRQAPTSPGPQRSPTDISLAQLERIESGAFGVTGTVSKQSLLDYENDPGEGTSSQAPSLLASSQGGYADIPVDLFSPGRSTNSNLGLGITPGSEAPPPDYESPESQNSDGEGDAADGQAGTHSRSGVFSSQKSKRTHKSRRRAATESAIPSLSSNSGRRRRGQHGRSQQQPPPQQYRDDPDANDDSTNNDNDRPPTAYHDEEGEGPQPLPVHSSTSRPERTSSRRDVVAQQHGSPTSPPIPSYDAAVGSSGSDYMSGATAPAQR